LWAWRENDADLWKHPVEYLKLRLPRGYLQPPIGTCYGAWVTDIGDPGYRQFMLEQAKSVEVVLRGLAGLSDKSRVEVQHPGVKNPVELNLRHQEAAVMLTAPLHHGCAMVRIVK
jgi:hypothetical protein